MIRTTCTFMIRTTCTFLLPPPLIKKGGVEGLGKEYFTPQTEKLISRAVKYIERAEGHKGLLGMQGLQYTRLQATRDCSWVQGGGFLRICYLLRALFGNHS